MSLLFFEFSGYYYTRAKPNCLSDFVRINVNEVSVVQARLCTVAWLTADPLLHYTQLPGPRVVSQANYIHLNQPSIRRVADRAPGGRYFCVWIHVGVRFQTVADHWRIEYTHSCSVFLRASFKIYIYLVWTRFNWRDIKRQSISQEIM